MSILEPISRMKLRSMSELQHPSACRVCGNGAYEEGYVDIDVYFEFEGWTYLCLSCLTEAAEAGGMLSKEESEHLKKVNESFAEENKTLRTLLEAANERLKHFDAILADYASSNDLPTHVPDAKDSETDNASGEPTNSDSDRAPNDGEGHKSKSTEPNAGSRPAKSNGSARSNITI